MELAERISLNALVKNMHFVLQLVAAFVMTPLILRAIGAVDYGYWVLVSTFIGYYGLLDFGLSSASGRYISRAIGKNNKNEIVTVFNTILVLFGAIGLICLLISLLFILFGSFIIPSGSDILLFSYLILIMGVSFAISFPVRAFYGLLTSYMRHDFLSVAGTCKILITNIGIFLVLDKGYGIIGMALMVSVGSIFEYILTIYYSYKVFPELTISKKHIDLGYIKSLFNYSGISFLIQLSDLLRFRVDAIVISKYVGLSQVAHYSIGVRLIELFGQLMTNTIGIISPIFSQYEGAGDQANIVKRFIQITKFSIIIACYVGMTIVIYGKAFIERWMGPDFYDSYLVLMILILPYIVAFMQNPSSGLFYGVSQHHKYAAINCTEGALNLLLSLILVQYYGILGVAMGTSLSMLVTKLFIQPFVICKIIKIKFTDYCSMLFIVSIKTLIPLITYYFAIVSYLKSEYFSIMTFLTLQLIITTPMIYFYSMDNEQRSMVNRIVAKVRLRYV